ncbi:MAG: hypothetical protein AB1566_12740 [Chloroflexota bacterium]
MTPSPHRRPLLLALSLVALFTLACAVPGLPFGPARVENITFTKALNPDASPGPAASDFARETVFCSVKVANLGRNTTITAHWFYGDKQVAEKSLVADKGGSGYVAFNWTPPGNAPGGTYRVDVSLNQVKKASATFTLAAPPTPMPSPATPTPPPLVTLPPPTSPPGPKVLYRDNFTDPTSGMPTESNNPSVVLMGYVDGEYEIKLVTAPRTLAESSWAIAPLPKRYGDFLFEVDARMTEDSTDGGYGLVGRYQDLDHYYKLLVDPYRQRLAFWKLTKAAGQTMLLNWQTSKYIKAGKATNRLGLGAKGSQLTVYVNGNKVGTVTDPAFKEGRLGLTMNAWMKPITARFSNLLVTAAE